MKNCWTILWYKFLHIPTQKRFDNRNYFRHSLRAVPYVIPILGIFGHLHAPKTLNLPLLEKCQNMQFFLVRIFLYLDQKKLRICTLFRQCACGLGIGEDHLRTALDLLKYTLFYSCLTHALPCSNFYNV